MYNTKYKSDGIIDKYKSCLVANGYAEKGGTAYTKKYAPMEKLDRIKMVLTLDIWYKWIIFIRVLNHIS